MRPVNPFRGVNLRDWGNYLIGFGKEERELALIKTIENLTPIVSVSNMNSSINKMH